MNCPEAFQVLLLASLCLNILTEKGYCIMPFMSVGADIDAELGVNRHLFRPIHTER